MAAFNFPNSPSTNDLHTENSVTWKWNGTVWKRVNNSYLTASTLNITGISTFGGVVKIPAVAGTNNAAWQNVLHQNSAGVIDGGSGLQYHPANDQLSVNGTTITSGSVYSNGGSSLKVADANYSSTTYAQLSNKVEIAVNDNVAGAFKLKEGTNEYITVDTTNSSELIKFGTAAQERLRIDKDGYLSFAGDTNTYIHHPSADQIAITRAGGSYPIIRFGSGGGGNTITMGDTTSNLVTNSEILSVRGYSSFKSTNKDYAAIYTHNEGNTSGTFNHHLMFNAGGANRGGFGYMPNTGELTLNHQYDITLRTGASGLSGTERLRIDTNGKSKFTRGSTGTVAHFYANARESNILIQNDAKTWKIVNYDYGNNGTDHLGFHDGSSDRLIIHDDGEGISFNGALSTNNCLGDYEKGSWSATMYGANSGTGTLFSYSTRVASYVRIGRMCFARLYYVISNRNSATGQVVIGGLPFSNAANYSYCPGVRAGNIGNGGTNGADVAAYSGDGWSTWYLTYGTNSGFSNLDCSQLNNNSTIMVEFVFEIWNG